MYLNIAFNPSHRSHPLRQSISSQVTNKYLKIIKMSLLIPFFRHNFVSHYFHDDNSNRFLKSTTNQFQNNLFLQVNDTYVNVLFLNPRGIYRY